MRAPARIGQSLEEVDTPALLVDLFDRPARHRTCVIDQNVDIAACLHETAGALAFAQVCRVSRDRHGEILRNRVPRGLEVGEGARR